MTELVAKPIIENHYWIVVDGQKKVGNITANNAGYGVTINGSSVQFSNTDEISNSIKITFDTTPTAKEPSRPFPEFPTPSTIYNSVIDVTRNLHLFTLEQKSKCLHAAGWFAMNDGHSMQAVFCPKYIFVQRYEYQGPFRTKDEALAAINSSNHVTH